MRRGKLKRMIDIGFTVCRRAGIPLYWSKYSKKTYTLHQHLLILALCAHFGWSMDRMLEFIEEDAYLRSLLRLRSVPHKSTLSRFKDRVPTAWFSFVFRRINEFVGGSAGRFAVDATGMRISKRSFYYTQKIGKKMKIRECMKLHAVLDIDTQIIVAALVTEFRKHDAPMLIPLLESVDSVREVYADKGYDSLRNIEYVVRRGGQPFIAVRKNARKGLRKRILKQMRSPEWKKKHGKRNRIECTFRTLKTVYGDHVYAHSFKAAVKFVLFKILAYNLYTCHLPFLIHQISCFSRNST